METETETELWRLGRKDRIWEFRRSSLVNRCRNLVAGGTGLNDETSKMSHAPRACDGPMVVEDKQTEEASRGR